jgi:hypothetical protein
MLTVVAITGLLSAISIPVFSGMLTRVRLRSACGVIAAQLKDASRRAVTTNRSTGLQFIELADGTWSSRLYEDGDGDGIRTADIRAGVDVPLGPERPILHSLDSATIGIAPGVVDPDNGRPLPPFSSPVAFGTPRICAFSPTAHATPGTIYVTIGGETGMVRSSGEGAIIRVFYFDRSRRSWGR